MTTKIQLPPSTPSWRGATPQFKRYDFFSRRRVAYRPPELRSHRCSYLSPPPRRKARPVQASQALASSNMHTISSLHSTIKACEKPLKLAQETAEFVERIAPLNSQVKAASHLLGQAETALSLISLPETAQTVHEKVSDSQANTPSQVVGTASSVVGFLSFIAHFLGFRLANILLNPLGQLINVAKNGFELQDHYHHYVEGQTSGGMTLLHLGAALSSIGLSLLALGALIADPFSIAPALTITLSGVHLGTGASLYYYGA